MSTNELNENTEQPDFFRDIPVPYAVFQLIYDEGRKKVVNTRYTYVNEAYCEMEGHGWEELIGRHFLDISLLPAGPGGEQDGPDLPVFEGSKPLAGFHGGTGSREGLRRLCLHEFR